jgi:hypothetical protein
MKLNPLSLHTTVFFLWSKYIENFTRFRFDRFRFVSFRSVRFRFVAFRFYFVSHFTGAPLSIKSWKANYIVYNFTFTFRFEVELKRSMKYLKFFTSNCNTKPLNLPSSFFSRLNFRIVLCFWVLFTVELMSYDLLSCDDTHVRMTSACLLRFYFPKQIQVLKVLIFPTVWQIFSLCYFFHIKRSWIRLQGGEYTS